MGRGTFGLQRAEAESGRSRSGPGTSFALGSRNPAARVDSSGVRTGSFQGRSRSVVGPLELSRMAESAGLIHYVQEEMSRGGLVGIVLLNALTLHQRWTLISTRTRVMRPALSTIGRHLSEVPVQWSERPIQHSMPR